MGNQVRFVLEVFLALFYGKGVAVYVEDLKVFEFCFFVADAPEVCDYLLETIDLIIAYREYIQF